MYRKLSNPLSVLTLAFVALSMAAAQGPVDEAEEPAAEQTVNLSSAPPALFSVGISGGFPSYQTVALGVSLQSSFVGIQAKAGWTAAGPFVGLQLRGYPPVPISVPLFVGVGMGVYGPNVSYHAALGTHVPLSRALRLDIEGGVALVPLLDGRALAPHLAVGVSYAIPLEVDQVASRTERNEVGLTIAERSRNGVNAPTCSEPVAPDEAALGDVVDELVDDWIRSARATYGSVYSDLKYSYGVPSSKISGTGATVSISYRGSVKEIATGKRHSASGTATAEFRWTGCVWVGGAVSY